MPGPETRVPLVGGASGGCGASTVARAVKGRDCGLYPLAGSPRVDILVCRSTLGSLSEATRALAAAPQPPVLAVVADIRRASLTGNMRAALLAAEPYIATTVHVPYVDGWRDLTQPLGQLPAASDRQWVWQLELPRSLRNFAAAMRDLAQAVVPLLGPPTAAHTQTVAAQQAPVVHGADLAAHAARAGRDLTAATPSPATAPARVFAPAAAARALNPPARPHRIGSSPPRPGGSPLPAVAGPRPTPPQPVPTHRSVGR
jgi:hypothetical protein